MTGNDPARSPKFWRRAARLTPGEALGIARAAFVICRVAVLLRRSSLLRLLDALGLAETAPPADAARIAHAAQLVRWGHRIVPWEPNCLLDSLAVAALVRRQGFSVPVAIGVKLQQGVLQAHAWLGAEEQKDVQDFRLLYGVPHGN